MNCPVCKTPNTPGATHCTMCYEVFNRSAAKSYLHAVRRERMMNEKEKTPSLNLEPFFSQLGAGLRKFDVLAAARFLMGFLLNYRQGLGLAAGAFVAVVFIFLFHSPAVHFKVFGSRLAYTFSEKQPARYLVSFHTDLRSFSERQGRLDTPLPSPTVDDIGTVLVQKKRSSKGQLYLAASALEWIQIPQTSEGKRSQSIPLNHSSLAPVAAKLNKRGVILERRVALSPRLAKSFVFMLPVFPVKAQHRGQTWSEPVEWVELAGDWKIYWAGRLKWTLEDQVPCGQDTCEHLRYRADIKPQIWGGPAWAMEGARRLRFSSDANGEAFFDARHGRLLSNRFSYSGLLRFPLPDLGRIPWNLRIGRRVRGVPGDIVLQLNSKIDINKN